MAVYVSAADARLAIANHGLNQHPHATDDRADAVLDCWANGAAHDGYWTTDDADEALACNLVLWAAQQGECVGTSAYVTLGMARHLAAWGIELRDEGDLAEGEIVSEIDLTANPVRQLADA